MAKKMGKLDIMNMMGDAADKKSKAFAGKESPEEEAAESKPMPKKKKPFPVKK